jgi:uncharacterized HAD superfamily protein
MTPLNAIEAKLKRNKAFRYSQTFADMVSAITSKNGDIDSEGYEYFPDREKATAGWEAFNDNDIKSMFELCSDPHSDLVDNGSYVENAECSFIMCDYTVGGLNVRHMVGDSPVITIFSP